MDQNYNRSRDNSCCTITHRNDSCTDFQRGCLCIARSPFAPEPLQDSTKGDYVILSVHRLYGKLEDFAVGKWTVEFGTKDPLVVNITPSDIVHLFTCCSSSSENTYRNICRCEASFSVLVLHKNFSDKLRVHIEQQRLGNRKFEPLRIRDTTNTQSFPITYIKQPFKKRRFVALTKNISLDGYFTMENEGKSSMLGEKVKAFIECIRYSVSGGEHSSSGSAILDDSMYVCGVHNVQLDGSTVSLSLDANYVATGTSVYQMASQLIGKQWHSLFCVNCLHILIYGGCPLETLVRPLNFIIAKFPDH